MTEALLGRGAAGAGEKAYRHSEHRAEHEPHDVFAQVTRGQETLAEAAQIVPQNVGHRTEQAHQDRQQVAPQNVEHCGQRAIVAREPGRQIVVGQVFLTLQIA